jgi:tetratricopeptide (TPR) repeat protein
LRILTCTLGAVLLAYCGAGVLSETAWLNNERVESVLCRVFLCTGNSLMGPSQEALAGVQESGLQRAIAMSKQDLQRNPQDPYRWADLGEAYLDDGQQDSARYCWGQVLTLAPQSPPLLLRVANFHFQIGENEAALPVTARILTLVPDYDELIFSEYTRLADGVDDVLRYGVPQNGRAAKSWLRFLMRAGRPSDAQNTWEWIADREYADDALAGEYADFLIRHGHPESAATVWAGYLGTRAGDYRKSNYLYNGDFESDPIQSPFDWAFAHAQGVEVSRDFATARSGKYSFRISFAGTDNLDLAAASQQTSVRPGPYRFHVAVRTESLTTDQGIRFRISDAEVRARLDVIFEQFTGTSPWSAIDRDLVVPPATRLLLVQVIRQPSLKFDNKVDGTAWVDELKLEPMSNLSPG